MKYLYQYESNVLKVIDGDTFDALIGLGFDVFVEKRVRLYGIDAPEKNTKEGQVAKERLKVLIEGKKVLLIAVEHEDKYGRFLARCVIDSQDLIAVSDITDLLLAEGFGREYYGGKKES